MRLFFFFVMVLFVGALGPVVPMSAEAGAASKTPEKALAAREDNVDGKMDQEEATELGAEESAITKQGRETGSAKGKDAQQVCPKVDLNADGGNGKAEDAKKPAGPAKSAKQPTEDRPWIIKKRDGGTPQILEEKAKPLKWNSEEQRVQCDTHLKELRRSLSKVRFYSVQGDTCATAKQAKNFVDLAIRCKNECPDGFLERKGYSEKIMRNVSVLLELGKKACLNDR
ncbi:MAG: hypothetical protein H8E10_11375 [Desulfobacterales bacterium]|jgi:hypothetical protein|nr:hypothetical protein [Desulfobacterales bacterium]MBL7101176.1 hypothetical protein [Desulfobacteraceae bacterium]MBL7171730.1 hypothetical protein [Desulfobacteraceae bacterium]